MNSNRFLLKSMKVNEVKIRIPDETLSALRATAFSKGVSTATFMGDLILRGYLSYMHTGVSE
jgi:hypothetical protein